MSKNTCVSCKVATAAVNSLCCDACNTARRERLVVLAASGRPWADAAKVLLKDR